MLMRLWLAIPDIAFRAVGALCFLGFLRLRVARYFDGSAITSNVSLRYTGSASTWYIPLGDILIDLTYLLIGLSFIFRFPPRRRADRARLIVVPMIATLWPLLPFMLQVGLYAFSPSAGQSYALLLRDWSRISTPRFLVGTALVIVGNGLDLWGYAYLFRSISVAAEARRLHTNGPYRFIRHPIYLGHFLSQAGVWACYVPTHWYWLAFYAAFVCMQLYRSRVEDDVLEDAFGEDYRDWRNRTFWFV